jgi:hypothetical protein
MQGAEIGDKGVSVTMAHCMVILEHGNHGHMWLLPVVIENCEPVLDGLSVLSLNCGEIALRTGHLVIHGPEHNETAARLALREVLELDPNLSRPRGYRPVDSATGGTSRQSLHQRSKDGVVRVECRFTR